MTAPANDIRPDPATALAAALTRLGEALETGATPTPKTLEPTRLPELRERFSLTEAEMLTLALLAGAALSPSFTRSAPLPAVDLSPTGILRGWHLVTGEAAALRLDPRILDWLQGGQTADTRLAPWLYALRPAAILLPRHETVAAEMAAALRAAPGALALTGAGKATRARIAQYTGQRLEMRAAGVDARLFEEPPERRAALLRLLVRETVLDHLLPVFEVAALNTDLTTQVHRLEVPSLTLSEKGAGLDPDAPRAFHLEPPDANERAGLWQAILGLKAPEEARALAEAFVLDADEIEAIARRTPQGPKRAAAARAEAVRALRPAADPLVRVLDPKAGWPDLILPQRTEGALRAITAQARHRHQVYAEWGFSGPTGRGRGLTALFSGPSGTGKTLAAEVIAHELDLGLLRVDLSQVVDKYVGETEKHLDRVFTLADRSGAVLLFDEAEALFRQRGDDDAGARHFVSMTVSYLLQRLESYRGTCLLTTNMRSAVDDAFLRRLRFVVPFAFPALAERQRLWAAAFPPEAPQTGLDHARLAALPVAGGTIRTIALNAAFLAAEDSREIGMTHVIAALELENAKLDQPIDLGPLRRRRAI